MTGLYIHIPFCFKKCNYCDFVSQDYETFAADAYINALSAEMQKYYGASIETVYIGGGTPSTFSVGQLEKLFKLIPKYFNLSHVKEFTVELNPESTTLEKLSLLKNNGVTRLSIGFQSPNDEELAFLGRAHNSSKFEEVLSQARSLFNNINIDLMYGFQSFDGWQNNLAQTLKFKPEHLSLYPLAVEEGTPFHKNGIKVDYNLQAKMYEYAVRALQNAGYVHYEISNWAKDGKQALHNSNYWRNKEYIGLGASSSSYVSRYRCKNTEDVLGYIKNPICSIEEKEFISDKLYNAEAAILGLRLLNEGVNVEHLTDDKVKQAMEKLLSQGLVLKKDDRVTIHPEYVFVSNQILQEFVES